MFILLILLLEILTDIEIFASVVVSLLAQIDGWAMNLHDRIMKKKSPYSWPD